MPLYEYECKHCEWIQEDLRSEELKDSPTYFERCNELCERLEISRTYCRMTSGSIYDRMKGML